MSSSSPGQNVVCRMQRVRGSRASRALAAMLGVCVLLGNLAGCYSYVPVTADVTPGSNVALHVTDRGRVSLEKHLGSGAQRLEGRVITATDSTVSLSLTAVRYLDQPAAVRWSGEMVMIDRDFVVDLRERRLSRSKSWLAAGVVGLAVAALTTLAIDGFGRGGSDNRPPGDGNNQD
jgi:hypothetical protein